MKMTSINAHKSEPLSSESSYRTEINEKYASHTWEYWASQEPDSTCELEYVNWKASLLETNFIDQSERIRC